MNESISQQKVYQVLELIAHSPGISQREMASSTGFSLGLVNLIIKRLAKTGHLKVSNLSKRKMEYLLTPKGVIEKAGRTYSYLTKTIGTFLEYQHRLGQLILDLRREGHSLFAVVGEGELVPLVEMVLKSQGDSVRYRHLPAGEAPREGETVLDCRRDGYEKSLGVSIMTHLLHGWPAPNGASTGSLTKVGSL